MEGAAAPDAAASGTRLCVYSPLLSHALLSPRYKVSQANSISPKTVLDTSSPTELTPAGELDLSSDEDSVSSLAVSYLKRGKSTVIYAGVNSSPADLKSGKNEHLRAFALDATRARAAGTGVGSAKLSETSRTALFSASHPEEYQRLLRLAPPSASGAQLGVAASGLGKDFEVALFETSASSSVPKAKGTLELAREANDVDVLQTGDEAYQVAYCHDLEIHAVDVRRGAVSESRRVWTTPEDKGAGSPPRAVFRAMRYLTPTFVLALANLPRRGGVVLQAIRLPAKADEKARVAAKARLPRHVAQATALAVRNLSPPAERGGAVGRAQFVAAVAGHDASVSLYTIEHRVAEGIEVLADMRPLATLREVHPLQITGLAFSGFAPPDKTTKAGAAGAGGKELALKMASISMANTVVVHDIPLLMEVEGAKRKGGPPRPVRYVVAAKRSGGGKGLVAVMTLLVLLLAIAGQVVLEMTGRSKPYLGSRGLWRLFGTLRSPEDEFTRGAMGSLPVEKVEKVKNVVLERPRADGEGTVVVDDKETVVVEETVVVDIGEETVGVRGVEDSPEAEPEGTPAGEEGQAEGKKAGDGAQ